MVGKQWCPECGEEHALGDHDGGFEPELPATLQECCAALHGSYTGAADPLREVEVKALRRHIREKLGKWRTGPEWSDAYDEAVRSLCEATLAEWRDDTGAPHFAQTGREGSDRPRNPESSPVASADPDLAKLLRDLFDAIENPAIYLEGPTAATRPLRKAIAAARSSLSRLAGQSAPVANESVGAARGLLEEER